MKKLFSIFVALTLFFSLSFLTAAAEEANKESSRRFNICMGTLVVGEIGMILGYVMISMF